MVYRASATKLILYASPIGALVAGSIFFTHPEIYLDRSAAPQLVAFESGFPAESRFNAGIPFVQPAALESAERTPTKPAATLLPQAAIDAPTSAAVPSSVPAAKVAALEPNKPIGPSLPKAGGAPLYTMIVEDAKPPKGWSEFCVRYPGECNERTSAPRDITLTPDKWDTIVAVNNWANQHIKPMTDMKHWGKVNKWYYADDGYGDCKDYALVKQRKLIEAGLPREALLIAIVWTRQNQGHAVLLVRTDKGEFVLDNLSKQVLLWSSTPYDYVKRQTRTNPNAWVYIDADPRKSSRMAANDIR